MKVLELAGRMNDASSEQLLALGRYQDAYEKNSIAAGPRFSIAEMHHPPSRVTARRVLDTFRY